MTTRSTRQGNFTTIRNYAAPVARVFQALANPEEKREWFEGPPGSKEIKREMDFREGGRERVSGRMDNGVIATFDCVYHDIVENERIVCSYVTELDGRRLAVSQTSIQLQPEDQGAKLTLIEYNEFLDGHDDAGAIQRGTEELFDKLGKYLKDA
jgi:uncharacterized protein YndB with AHSA1/START domain